MTDTTDQLRATVTLLSDAEAYLSALHGAVARHDNLGADLTCGGCQLRDRIAPALAVARQVLGTTTGQPETEAPAVDRRERYAAAIREADGWVLDDGQHMIDAVMAVADVEQAALRAEVEGLDEALRGAIAVSEKDGARLRAEMERRTLMLQASRDQVATLRRLADEAQQPTPAVAETASCGCGTYMRCPNGHCSRHYTCQDCGNCCSCECGQPATPAPAEETTP